MELENLSILPSHVTGLQNDPEQDISLKIGNSNEYSFFFFCYFQTEE